LRKLSKQAQQSGKPSRKLGDKHFDLWKFGSFSYRHLDILPTTTKSLTVVTLRFAASESWQDVVPKTWNVIIKRKKSLQLLSGVYLICSMYPALLFSWIFHSRFTCEIWRFHSSWWWLHHEAKREFVLMRNGWLFSPTVLALDRTSGLLCVGNCIGQIFSFAPVFFLLCTWSLETCSWRRISQHHA
jgi:hypothetical protein